MLLRVARAAIFLVTVLVTSTLARSAFASGFTGYYGAPFCDDRGATALAPRPDLEAPDAAWQQTRSDACDLDGNTWRVMVRPTGTRIVATLDESAPADRAPSLLTMPTADSYELTLTEVTGRPSPGARLRVERPPRA
jgi:hypothetical protein